MSRIENLDEMQGQRPAKFSTAPSSSALGKKQEPDAKIDQVLPSTLKRLNVDDDIVDLYESEEMKELAGRVKGGKGMEADLFKLLAHAREWLNTDGQARRGFSIEPSNHPGDVPEEYDEEQKQEVE